MTPAFRFVISFPCVSPHHVPLQGLHEKNPDDRLRSCSAGRGDLKTTSLLFFSSATHPANPSCPESANLKAARSLEFIPYSFRLAAMACCEELRGAINTRTFSRNQPQNKGRIMHHVVILSDIGSRKRPRYTSSLDCQVTYMCTYVLTRRK